MAVYESSSFVLEEEVQFGFHPVCSDQITISGLRADKMDPSSNYAHGVVYGAKPLRGTAEFEVEIVSYGTGWSGSLKLGVMRCKAGAGIQREYIPRYSPEAKEHCVWSADKVFNRLGRMSAEKDYGSVKLDDLQKGDRLGMRLSEEGVLVFFVNGKWQGVAAEGVYENDLDVYPVVDLYANCTSVRITRAAIGENRIQGFVMKADVQFGFHSTCPEEVEISGLRADKKDPSSNYAHGVVYGAKPLRGTAEFEVEIVSYGTGWSGSLKLGVMRCKAGAGIQREDIPRYSPEAKEHCVWSANKLFNRLGGMSAEKDYGSVDVEDLRKGDRLRMRLSEDGVLVFFVNGKPQGVAAEEVYRNDLDVYPVVDHYGNCIATRIVRASCTG